MRPKTHRLQTRIARYIAFAVVASLVLSAMVLVAFRHRAIQQTMEASAMTYASLVSDRLVDQVVFFESTGRGMIDQVVAEMRELNRDVERLEVVDVRGRVMLRTDSANVTVYGEGGNPPVITDRELLRAISGLDTTADRIVGADGRRVFRVVSPVVMPWGGHHYSVIGSFSYYRVNRQLRSSLWLSALILGIGLGLAQWSSVRLAGGITGGVERLREGVERLQEGNLDERVLVDSPDEIGDLADGFNLMADELVANIHRLREANRELETLDQTKADLVANVSHELKTPLTALRGYLELMADGGLGSIPDDARRAVTICQKNVQRLTLRVEELVQLAHLDRFTALDAEREEVDLKFLLEGVADMFQPRMESRSIDLALRMEPGLPSIEANAEQIERVLMNLFDNAVKFTSDGGSVLVIAEASDNEDRDGILVRVQDSGVGIAHSELVRIFDRFHQVDPSSRRRFGGMGLGLSLVRSIVEAHLGSVWAESEPGVGSTFYVWLPTVAVALGEGAEGAASATVEAAFDVQ